MIDLILKQNPDAVIILQSDHGWHLPETVSYLYQTDISDYDLFELIHSTLSAVRIPSRYGGINEPIAPINLTRELVNRFVGQNYELAQPHTNPVSRHSN